MTLFTTAPHPRQCNASYSATSVLELNHEKSAWSIPMKWFARLPDSFPATPHPTKGNEHMTNLMTSLSSRHPAPHKYRRPGAVCRYLTP